MDKIAVLIPCYNEEKTIAKVVSDVKKFLPEAVTYVYDNNSTDRTVELATEAGAIIRHEYAQGKGNVIRRMFREIDAECYLIVPGRWWQRFWSIRRTWWWETACRLLILRKISGRFIISATV